MGDDVQWKKAEKPQIIQNVLGHPQLRPLIDDWERREPDPRIRSSLNDKLARLSPDRPFWVAALLFDLYQNPETLPTYCKTAAGQRSEEEASNEIFQEALPHYFRLQKVSTVSNTPKVEKQANLAIRMIASLLSDVQLVSVYLALRMQKLEWPEPLDDEEKQQSAWLNLNVDAPLASRIGIFWIKSELEDRAFQILQPEQYADLKRLVARKRDQRRMLVDKTLQEIQKMLQEAGLKHQVQGRYKRFYSIFEKLKRVDDDFEKIHDLTGFRVLVEHVRDCFTALSYIHERWIPIDDRYKDYISQPKPNGYQSLHTTVLNDEGEPLEIQIRTQEMHRVAENGFAAHWLYKSSSDSIHSPGENNPGKDLSHPRKKKNPEIHANESLPDSVKKIKKKSDFQPGFEFYSDKIFVRTPKRDIFELPRGATAIDFAYAIHTGVGNRIIGAKTNGTIIKLEIPLENGDMVEIMTSTKQVPRKEWLDLVKTRHARNKIKHALLEQHRETCRKQGTEMLEKEFRGNGLNLSKMIRDGKMDQECRTRKNQSFEHILFCIGDGSIRCEELSGWFLEKSKEVGPSVNEDPAETGGEVSAQGSGGVQEKIFRETVYKGDHLIVEGTARVNTRLAKCCQPKQGDPIRGYLTQGGAVTVHHQLCRSLRKLNPNRMLSVHWDISLSKEKEVHSD